jgi:hypothetical protein
LDLGTAIGRVILAQAAWEVQHANAAGEANQMAEIVYRRASPMTPV